jgi:periplasmic protein TonB
MVPPPAATVTTPLANVGHAPLGVGKCVGLVPPPVEPPEDEPDASARPPELEPDPELELLDPLDDPEPLDEPPPPLELELPEPPPLLEPPLDPPSLPEPEEAPELPHEATSPAITKATAVFMVCPGTNPRSLPGGNRWKSERRPPPARDPPPAREKARRRA